MERAAVAADEQRGAVEQRTELSEREVAARQDTRARFVGQSIPGRGDDAIHGVAFRRPRCDDDAPVGLRARERRDERDEMIEGPAPERVARADVDEDHAVRGLHAGARQPFGDAGRRDRVRHHLDRVNRPLRRIDAEHGEQVPLVLHRVAPPELTRSSHSTRVHPAPACHVVPHAEWRAAEPGEERGARPAMKVDRYVEASVTKTPAEREVRTQPAEAAPPRRNDHLVEMGVVDDDRRCGWFDDVADVRAGKAPAQRMHGGCREDDVANLTETDEKEPLKLVSWRVGEFVNEKLPESAQNHQVTNSRTHQLTHSPATHSRWWPRR